MAILVGASELALHAELGLERVTAPLMVVAALMVVVPLHDGRSVADAHSSAADGHSSGAEGRGSDGGEEGDDSYEDREEDNALGEVFAVDATTPAPSRPCRPSPRSEVSGENLQRHQGLALEVVPPSHLRSLRSAPCGRP